MQSLHSQYEDSLKSEHLIHKDEDSRRLHVRLLFQEEENDDLQGRLATVDDRIFELEAMQLELQAQVEQAENYANQCQAELRIKSREIDTLKVGTSPPSFRAQLMVIDGTHIHERLIERFE